MNVLLVHGWGADSRIWEPFLKVMKKTNPSWKPSCIDFGFFGSPHWVTGEFDLVVGHSLGALWLLHQPEIKWRSYCSIAGFTRFAAGEGFPTGIPLATLRRMQRNLERDCEAQLNAFWDAAAGSEVSPSPPDWGRADRGQLDWGLDALKSWDGREQWERLGAGRSNWLGIAARRDPIVPAELSTACFPRLSWIDTDSHLLPWTHPRICAQLISNAFPPRG